MAGEKVCEGMVYAYECSLQTYNLYFSIMHVYISLCIYTGVYTHTSHTSHFPMRIFSLYF